MHRNNATGNAAAETKLDCGPSFDNLLAERGYHTEYYGKYHSPYLMALTYKNKVSYAGAKFEGAPSERQQYLAYLDKHSPARPLKPRELISKEFNRSYIPAILDAHFPNPNDETRQGEVYGVADSQGAVPRGVYGG